MKCNDRAMIITLCSLASTFLFLDVLKSARSISIHEIHHQPLPTIRFLMISCYLVCMIYTQGFPFFSRATHTTHTENNRNKDDDATLTFLRQFPSTRQISWRPFFSSRFLRRYIVWASVIECVIERCCLIILQVWKSILWWPNHQVDDTRGTLSCTNNNIGSLKNTQKATTSRVWNTFFVSRLTFH